MPHLTLHPELPRLDLASRWAEKELVRQVPGARWDSTRKTWHVPRSWAACVQLRGIFSRDLTMDDAVRDWARCERARVDRATALRSALGTDLTYHDRLFDYQQACVAWSESTVDGLLLGNDMGTGKTATVLVTLERAPDALPAIVVCPNSVKHHWATEAIIWAPSVTPYVIAGGAGTRRKQLAKAAEDPTALVVINYESLRLHARLAPYGSVRLRRCPDCGGDDERVTDKKCEVHQRELNLLGARTVILDEAHRCKTPTAKQTRAAWSICHGPTITRRIALTGTPIANHVGDLWSVMHAVAPHEYPTKSAFMDRYALLSWNAWGGMDVVGLRPDTRDELYRFLDPRFRRVTKNQVLSQLPPKVRSVRHAPPTPKMRKAYKELEDSLVTKLDGGEVLFTPNNLTASLRLLQLSSSYGEVLEDGSYRLTEPSPKLDVLEEILEEMEDRPVAVCALSRQLIELAAKRLADRGESYGLITGAVSELDRKRALEDFQSGRLRVLLFTIQAGGTGLTMTAADTIVFLQRSWSLLDNRQAEDRVHRIGAEQHEAVHIIDVMAPETIEDRQVARLHEKLHRLEEITRDGELEEMNDDLRNEPL